MSCLKTLSERTSDREFHFRLANEIQQKAEKEGRTFTADEGVAIDDHLKKVEEIDAQIADIKAHQDRVNRINATNERLSKPAGRTTAATDPGAGTNPAVARDPVNAPAWAGFKRPGQLKAFKGPNAERNAYVSGMWARAKLFNDHRAARWLNDNIGFSIQNAMGENSDPAGGYLVPEEFAQTIIDLREQYGVFRREARVVEMGRDTMLIPRRAGGVTIYPIGENPSSAITQSQPTWSQVRLTAKKCGGLTLMSTEVAEDAIIGLAEWLANEFAYSFALFEDQCGFIGDGTSTYLGIRGLGNMFTTTGGVGGGQLVGAVDAASAHDTFAEIDKDDLAKVMAALPAYVTNPKWYASKVAAELVFGRLQAGAGGNTIETLSNGRVGRSYLGYEIVISQVLPTSQGDLSDLPMLYFGDLSKAATMGDRRSMTVFPSEHRYMDTDQIGVRATERVDIVVHDVGDTTTGNAGPIVALVGE